MIVRNNDDCLPLVKYLLKKNMSIGTKNRIGKTIIDYSILLSSEIVLNFLLGEVTRLGIDNISYDWALLNTALASQYYFTCLNIKLAAISIFSITNFV